MSDKPEPTAEEKMADALPAYAKYVAAHQNSRRGLPVKIVMAAAAQTSLDPPGVVRQASVPQRGSGATGRPAAKTVWIIDSPGHTEPIHLMHHGRDSSMLEQRLENGWESL
jgi:hypothetical protein